MTAGEGGSALWYIPDLQDGLELVKKLDPYDDSAVKLKPCESFTISLSVTLSAVDLQYH